MVIDDQLIVYFYKPPFGKIIGSYNEYKIKRMIERDYKSMSIHREVLSCSLYDFTHTLEGNLHNAKWND